MGMKEERLGKISELMGEIKRKMETVAVRNEMMREFNYKMEALLAAFDAYTSDAAPEEAKGNTKNKGGRKEKASIPECPAVPGEETLREFLCRAESLLSGNKWLRSSLSKVVECLYGAKGGVLLETIIKKSGVSKYRCVDTLNMMLKTDPPLASKRFDRGFIYTLNVL
jgi:hypothetical protein